MFRQLILLTLGKVKDLQVIGEDAFDHRANVERGVEVATLVETAG